MDMSLDRRESEWYTTVVHSTIVTEFAHIVITESHPVDVILTEWYSHPRRVNWEDISIIQLSLKEHSHSVGSQSPSESEYVVDSIQPNLLYFNVFVTASQLRQPEIVTICIYGDC